MHFRAFFNYTELLIAIVIEVYMYKYYELQCNCIRDIYWHTNLHGVLASN